MSPIPHKSVFEPKDARVISMYDDDGDDEEELEFLSLTSTSDITPRPRRKKTGTQALAEFLITTSPEEFQKSPPKRSSNPFFRRRNKSKPSSSSTPTSALTAYRAFSPNSTAIKHVELVPSDTIKSNSTTAASLSRIASRAPSLGSKPPSVFRRSLMSNGDLQSPILPSNRNSKARESSLYSDSLRYSLSTRSQTSIANSNNNNNYHFMSVRSQHSLLKRQDTDVSLGAAGGVPEKEQHQEEEDVQEREAKATETLVNHYASNLVEEFDIIERALAQRLERFRQSNMHTPSEAVAAGLAMEHVRALEASNQAQYLQLNTPTQTVGEFKEKKKVRHMQVQTMPVDDKPQKVERLGGVGHSLKQEQQKMVTDDQGPSDNHLIEQLQAQLAEETRRRKRLQAALNDTCDHFEALSGLAYKRLRELWEEKMHWENACIELRERMLDTNKRDDTIAEFAESVI